MSRPDSEITAFKEYLKRNGYKFTQEREIILKKIVSLKGHFNPEELFTLMKGEAQKVSKASIYRTIPLLVESGLIKQVEKTDKHAHYERIYGFMHHDHMLCMSCGNVIEFYSKPLERLQESICRTEGFESVSHTLEIMGYCKDCCKEKNSKDA